MRTAKLLSLTFLLISTLPLQACSEDVADAGQASQSEAQTRVIAESAIRPEAEPVDAEVQGEASLLVHKSETCGCCALWVDHLTEEGVSAEVQNEVDMEAVKARLGISERYRSCHTAVSRDGYVFEGHVPALAIRRFMQDPPEGALGLAVPGMPIGSPGMEVDNQFQPYEIKLLMKDGSAKPYGYVSNYEAQFSPRAPEDGHAHQSRAPHNHD